MTTNTDNLQIATLMPTGVDVRMSIVDHDGNQLYQSDWTLTPKWLESIREGVEISREELITFALIKLLSYDHPLHKVDRIEK